MLKFLHGVCKLNLLASQEEIIFKFLESPGTKSYSKYEMKKIITGFGFEKVKIDKFASTGDLLLMPPSEKYKKNILYKIVQKFYPRNFVKKLERIFGLAITVTAQKPLE